MSEVYAHVAIANPVWLWSAFPFHEGMAEQRILACEEGPRQHFLLHSQNRKNHDRKTTIYDFDLADKEHVWRLHEEPTCVAILSYEWRPRPSGEKALRY